jgi:hypothetical protein
MYEDASGNKYDSHKRPIPDSEPSADPNVDPAGDLPDIDNGGASGNLPDAGQPSNPSSGLPSDGGDPVPSGGAGGGDIDPSEPDFPDLPELAHPRGGRKMGSFLD